MVPFLSNPPLCLVFFCSWLILHDRALTLHLLCFRRGDNDGGDNVAASVFSSATLVQELICHFPREKSYRQCTTETADNEPFANSEIPKGFLLFVFLFAVSFCISALFLAYRVYAHMYLAHKKGPPFIYSGCCSEKEPICELTLSVPAKLLHS